MAWIIALNIAALLAAAAVLIVRNKDSGKAGGSGLVTPPPRSYANLAQIEMVDVHALFSRWED